MVNSKMEEVKNSQNYNNTRKDKDILLNKSDSNDSPAHHPVLTVIKQI